MKLHHVAITVTDLEHSIAFYKNHFGFEEVKRFERSDLNGRAVFLALGDVRLELWEFKGLKVDHLAECPSLQRVGIRHIAFAVNNIKEECRRLLANGVEASEPRMGASGGVYAFLSDPDGIQVELYQDEA